MKILLDTDVVSFLMRDQSLSLKRRLTFFAAGDVAMSAITAAELHFGVRRTSPSRNQAVLDRFMALLVVAPFDADAAMAYGEVRADLERRGRPIGPHDMLIAAHAIALGIPLATNNVREFGRVSGLTIRNWRA